MSRHPVPSRVPRGEPPVLARRYAAEGMTIDFLTPLIGPGMAEVDAALKRALDSRVALIRQIADYIIGGGGKRLRPALLLLAAGACGHAGREQYTLAAVIEMI